MVDIPKEETLLNPIKTAQAIEKWYLINYSKNENKNKFPYLFTSELMELHVQNKVNLKIIGSLNAEIEKRFEFILSATYPKNYLSKCNIGK